MSLAYRTLLNLLTDHSYYTSGECPDLSYRPLDDTLELMGRHRWMLRPNKRSRATGFRLAFEADYDTGDPRFPLTEDVRLRFGVYLEDQRFLSSTLESQVPSERGEIIRLYSNGPAALSLSRLQLRGDRFTYGFAFVGAGPVNVQVKDAGGLDLDPVYHTQAESDNGNDFTVRIDLSEYPEGIYTLHFPGAETADFTFYHSQSLLRSGAMGIVELDIANTYDTSNPVTFTTGFAHRVYDWKYYTILPGAGSHTVTDGYLVSTTPHGGPFTFTEHLITGASPQEYQDKEAQLALMYPGTTIKLFISDSAIPLFEEARKKVQLKNGSSVIIANLPNPVEDEGVVVV